MTKQEKIQESYGEYWETVKDFVDENGWTQNRLLIPDFKIRNYASKRVKGQMLTYKYRPKLLQGIENNNGWIKIDSAEDFPKKDIECYVTNNIGRIQFAEFELENQRFYVENTRMYPTHYQPIIKPNYPIY